MSSGTMPGELVTFRNPHGFHNDGIVFRGPSSQVTVIHVHGSYGNFFQNQFVREMATVYVEAGINLLSFNLTCHDGLAEGYRNENEFEYVGGSIADFSTCVDDLQGAIDFAKSFSDNIVLQGHSLGCDRVLHFLISRELEYDFVLLAPCDSYQLQTNWIYPETVEQQIARLNERDSADDDFDWLPSTEYGIRQTSEWTYKLPITRKALLSIIDGPPFRLIRIGKPASFSLGGRALVYLGGNDPLQTVSSEEMFRYFEARIPHLHRVYISRGDHMLGQCEQEVAAEIVQWIKRRFKCTGI